MHAEQQRKFREVAHAAFAQMQELQDTLRHEAKRALQAKEEIEGVLDEGLKSAKCRKPTTNLSG